MISNAKTDMPGGAGGCSEVLALVEVDDLLRFN